MKFSGNVNSEMSHVSLMFLRDARNAEKRCGFQLRAGQSTPKKRRHRSNVTQDCFARIRAGSGGTSRASATAWGKHADAQLRASFSRALPSSASRIAADEIFEQLHAIRDCEKGSSITFFSPFFSRAQVPWRKSKEKTRIEKCSARKCRCCLVFFVCLVF